MENNIEIKGHKRTPKTLIIVLGLTFAIIMAVVLALGIISHSFESKTKKIQKQLELGEKYLIELDYENAILAYENVISMDPAADVYSTLMGAYDKQIDTLIHDKRLEDALDYYDRKITSLERGINYGYDYEELLATTKEERDIIELQSSATNVRIESVTVEEKGGRRTVSKYTYDEAGRLVREPHSNLWSPIINCYIDIEYDEHGRKAKETYNYFDVVWEDGTECEAFESFAWIHQYEGNKEKVYWGDTMSLSHENEYDEHGNVVKDSSFGKNGDLVSEYERAYDEKGRLISITDLTSGYKWFYVYDINENEIEEYIKNHPGNEGEEYDYIIREGLIEKNISYDEFGGKSEVITENDYLGNMISQKYYYNGEFSCSMEYEYVYLK